MRLCVVVARIRMEIGCVGWMSLRELTDVLTDLLFYDFLYFLFFFFFSRFMSDEDSSSSPSIPSDLHA